jgi:hypothetical protein
MKHIFIILCAVLTASCASHEGAREAPLDKPTIMRPAPVVRTAETVKAYPVGRYIDPEFPEVMHELHTLYREEQTAGWNLQSSEPYSIPLGPVVARSNPSPSYYVPADTESRTAQQQAYAEALAEQNRALSDRIEELLRQKDDNGRLHDEIERLRQQLEEARMGLPFSGSGPVEQGSDQEAPADVDGVSVDGDGLSLFDEFTATVQEDLLSQMRLNDDLTLAHTAAQLTQLPGFWTIAQLHLLPIIIP